MDGNKIKGSSSETNGCAVSRGSRAADALLMRPFKDGMLEECGGSQVGRRAEEAELEAEPGAPPAPALRAAKQKPSLSPTAASLAHFASKTT